MQLINLFHQVRRNNLPWTELSPVENKKEEKKKKKKKKLEIIIKKPEKKSLLLFRKIKKPERRKNINLSTDFRRKSRKWGC